MKIAYKVKFSWNERLWCVVTYDGKFTGMPCTSWEEACELANQHEGSRIFAMVDDNWGDYYSEEEN